MLITHLTHSFRMAATPFICHVQDPESLKIPEDNHRHEVSSKVFVTVIIMLAMGLIGCVIWMNLKDCPQHNCYSDCLPFPATVTFNGTNSNFTALRYGKYLIYGEIYKQEGITVLNNCSESFRLLTTQAKVTEVITKRSLHQHKGQILELVELKEDAKLSIKLNCDETKIDEAKSFLKIYHLIV